MNPILKNILAVVAGLIIGSVVNMGLVSISGSIIPYPEGYDASTNESMKETFHLLQSKHLIIPFLAHAFGTFFGALCTALVAASRKMALSLLVAVFFFAGGLYMVMLLPSPTWFNILDLAVAYFPMAWIASYLAGGCLTKKN